MLKFLIIIVSVFFLLRILGRMFVISSFTSMNKRMEEQWRRQQQPDPSPEGRVTVKSNSTSKQKPKDGEYVDYEEVK